MSRLLVPCALISLSLVACGGDPTDDLDGDGWFDGLDCAPDDAQIHPGAAEVCDGLDNDCNGLIDDEDGNLVGGQVWYADLDGDGAYGLAMTTQACQQPDGHGEEADDCDDLDATTAPGLDEVCDGADNDCSGEVDEGDTCADSWVGDLSIDAPAQAEALCAETDGTVVGDVTIDARGWDDLSSLSCLTHIYGHLAVLGSDDMLAMPALVHLSGDLDPASTQADAHIVFAGLSRVGGTITLSDTLADSAAFPALTRVGGLHLAGDLGSLSFDALVHADRIEEDGGDGTALSIPALSDVDHWVVSRTARTTVDLSSVGRIGSVSLNENIVLESIVMPAGEGVGDLLLRDNPAVERLELPDTTALRSLSVEGHPLLSTIALPALTSVERNIALVDLPELDTITVPALTTLGGVELRQTTLTAFAPPSLSTPPTRDLRVWGNPLLASLEVGTATTLSGSAEWGENSLLDATPLTGLQSVDGDLTVLPHADTTTLSFDDLQRVGGRLKVHNADHLQALSFAGLTEAGQLQLEFLWALDSLELGALQTVEDALSMRYLTDLALLELGALQSTGPFSLDSLSALTTLDLQGLVATGAFSLNATGQLDLLDAPMLTDIAGTFNLNYCALTAIEMPALAHIGDNVWLRDYTVASVDLASLEQVEGHLILQSFDALEVLYLPSLRQVDGHLSLSHLGRDAHSASLEAPLLEHVDGALDLHFLGVLANTVTIDLPALRSVDGSLDLRGLGGQSTAVDVGLGQLAGGVVDIELEGFAADADSATLDLGALQSTTGDVAIHATGLEGLDGWGDLHTIAGSLEIHANEALIDLDGMAALHTVGADLQITDNTALGDAAAQAFADSLTVGGSTTISGN